MSISLKQFKEGDFKKRNYANEHPVLTFLKKKKRAFTIKEIAKTIKINKRSIHSMLAALKKRGLVEHKTPYFVYKKYL